MMPAVLLIVVLALNSIQFISATTNVCYSTASCGCSAEPAIVTPRIVGGETAGNYTWSWMVSLQLSGSHICGASLLTSEYAVTAAHCVKYYLSNPSQLSILAGTNYLDDTTSETVQRRTIMEIISHPNYDPAAYTDDIAIIKFYPLNMSPDYKLAFICLPNENQDPFVTNTDLVATGWGYTYENSFLVSNTLQQVVVEVFSLTSSDCMQSGLTNSGVQFCAGINGGGKDTCQGDSGGPLMASVNGLWVLAGITSFGFGCAQPGYPGVYTRVSAFIPFIDSCINPTTTPPSTTKSPRPTTTFGPITNHGNIFDAAFFILMVCFSLWFLH